ncbi:GPN-loop GTPase 2 [Cichlidogyrus casuarinus]|uniref:GPN-loop GTPase 2 n=1 Tax=Cichlidogyrus casuarinus TaxID=1844966 RepID=A0ABD2PXX8_9PLAT
MDVKKPDKLGYYGQIIIGPPGSGKTTYTDAICNFMSKIGRDVFVINLDPANNYLPYKSFCYADISSLIRLQEVMQALTLGPNGGLLYCIAFLWKNIEWLTNHLRKLKTHSSRPYLLIDCPGQIELFINDENMKNIIVYLTQGLGLNLSIVNLIDSHHCSDAGNFISAVLVSLSAMLHLSLPHINLLSKADLLSQFGSLPFNIDFFTEVLDLKYLIKTIDDNPLFRRYKRLNLAIASLVQDYSIVKFLLLDIQNYASLNNVLSHADKASGYVFSADENKNIQQLVSSTDCIELSVQTIQRVEERFAKNE